MPPPPWIPAFAGMTKATLIASLSNHAPTPWIPAFAGMTEATLMVSLSNHTPSLTLPRQEGEDLPPIPS